MPTELQQHQYQAGETFEYYYEGTEATYTTDRDGDGAIARVTDLQKLEEVHTRIRFSILSGDDRLRKRIELVDAAYRELTAVEVAEGRTVLVEPLADLIPGFPPTFTHEYAVNGDGGVAKRLNDVFEGFSHPALAKLVDIFTWPANIEAVPEGFAPGQTTIAEGLDVTLFGGTFHNHHRVTVFDRIDRIGGVAHAYVKFQSPGNYFDVFGVETNYQLTCHIPLEGPATGLVSRGELQEMVFIGGQGGAPTSAIQRQVSMTLQSDDVRSAVDASA